MIEKIKLFTADIDNTLRGKERPAPGPLTIQAFEQMHQEGILVGIASGRPLWQGVSAHAEDWGLSFQFDFLIGMNGGELWTKQDNRTRGYHLLSTKDLETIVTALRSCPGINPFVYRNGYELSEKDDEEIRASGRRHGCPVEICKDDSDLWSEPTGKILYRCDTDEQAEALEKYGREVLDGHISCFRTVPDLVELQDARCSKGTALNTYCHEQQIDPENVIAFGDAENDIEMLKEAGWSVCLKNGMDDVKKICSDVTEHVCDDDGVGHYLYDHKLI